MPFVLCAERSLSPTLLSSPVDVPMGSSARVPMRLP